MYEKALQCDKSLIAEQRTNVLMRNGEHYNKKAAKMVEDFRTRGVISKENKIRITKNQLHRITNIYSNAILDTNSTVLAEPFNPQELHDKKTAEMNNSVMSWVRDTNSYDKLKENFINDFTIIGEVAAKVRFDYSKGPVIVEAEDGQKLRAGEFVIDRVFGFDLRRDPSARSIEGSRWLIHEEMMDLDEFKDIVKENNSEMLEKVRKASERRTLRIFDSNTGKYRDSKNEVFVRELFVRKSAKYPEGYYVLWAEDFVVMESELPFGIFPIAYGGFDELTTSPRHSGIIRVCRPFQVEINRSSSKMAEHQITLGDDRVYIQKGTKISSGGKIHGVRAIQVAGQQPTIQEGRSGAQYLEYQLSQVNEMYEAANVAFVLQNKEPKADVFAMLFASAKDKKVFSKYIDRFSRFEIDLFKIVLQYAKEYLEPIHIIKSTGRDEAVNIPEFKSTKDTGFEIKVVAASGDIEERFAKQLAVTNALQYVGSSLPPEQVGQLIKMLPLGENAEAFSTLTIDTDNLENDILALDRGEQIIAQPSDDPVFVMRGLSHRMKKSDFRFLPPEVQLNYSNLMAQHQAQFEAREAAKLAAEKGLIPAGGQLVTVNISDINPVSGKIERIKLPAESVEWLVKQLNTQGFFAQTMQELPPEVAQGINTSPAILSPEEQTELSQVAPAIFNEAASL